MALWLSAHLSLKVKRRIAKVAKSGKTQPKKILDNSKKSVELAYCLLSTRSRSYSANCLKSLYLCYTFSRFTPGAYASTFLCCYVLVLVLGILGSMYELLIVLNVVV